MARIAQIITEQELVRIRYIYKCTWLCICLFSDYTFINLYIVIENNLNLLLLKLCGIIVTRKLLFEKYALFVQPSKQNYVKFYIDQGVNFRSNRKSYRMLEHSSSRFAEVKRTCKKFLYERTINSYPIKQRLRSVFCKHFIFWFSYLIGLDLVIGLSILQVGSNLLA